MQPHAHRVKYDTSDFCVQLDPEYTNPVDLPARTSIGGREVESWELVHAWAQKHISRQLLEVSGWWYVQPS